jgi:hypothetical protein
MLIFRSFCEVVIAGEIDRTSPDPDTFVEIHRARCVIYGLASIPFAWCMTYAMGIGGKDVVTELKDEVEPEIRQLLKDRLTLLTEDGAKTAPQLEPILLELERQVEDARKNQNNSPPSGQDNPPSGLDPNASLHSNPNHLFGRDASGSNSRPRNDAKDEKDELRHHLKVRFIKRLIGRYADWEPILKQDSQVIASQGTGNPPI